MIGPVVYGGCGGGTDKSGGGPGGGSGVMIASLCGIASTFFDSIMGPMDVSDEENDFCGASGLCIEGGAEVVPSVVKGTGEVIF